MILHNLLILLLSAIYVYTVDTKDKQNELPEHEFVLVGILTQPTSDSLRAVAYNPEVVWSFVAGSYVDYVS